MRSRRHPSAALVVSVVALVLALAGTSYALVVTSSMVKNRSLKGIDVAKNTLTGTEINESKLARVPDALKLNGTPASAFVKTTTFRVLTGRLANGENRIIGVNGSLSLNAKCTMNSGGTDFLQIFAATTLDGAVMEGVDAHQGGGDLLNIATLETDRELVTNSIATGTQNVDNSTNDGFVMGSDGTFISVDGDQAVLGIHHSGSECLFSLPITMGKV